MIINRLINILISENLTISTAESVTGGYIAKVLTDKAGASKYFLGSLVTYSNMSKEKLLYIDTSAGVVNEKTSIDMAVNVRKIFNSHISISITGYAEKFMENPPSAYICVCFKDKMITKCVYASGSREDNREFFTEQALDITLQLISEVLKI